MIRITIIWNLIDWSLGHAPPLQKHQNPFTSFFFRYFAHRQTDRPLRKHKLLGRGSGNNDRHHKQQRHTVQKLLQMKHIVYPPLRHAPVCSVQYKDLCWPSLQLDITNFYHKSCAKGSIKQFGVQRRNYKWVVVVVVGWLWKDIHLEWRTVVSHPYFSIISFTCDLSFIYCLSASAVSSTDFILSYTPPLLVNFLYFSVIRW